MPDTLFVEKDVPGILYLAFVVVAVVVDVVHGGFRVSLRSWSIAGVLL